MDAYMYIYPLENLHSLSQILTQDLRVLITYMGSAMTNCFVLT